MANKDDVQGAVTDPETGHEESTFALWHDPTTYDLMKHGPPYLPGSDHGARVASTQASKKQVKDAVRPLVEKTSADALTELLVILNHVVSDFSELPMSCLAGLLAFLRAESMVHQAHHWQSKGENSYGDHLLFERLYNAVIEDVDKLAERMVGMGQPVLANPLLHAKYVSAVVQTFYAGAGPDPSSNEHVLISLRAALRTLVLIKIIYGSLDQKGLLSHGTDNLLQGIADKHEEHVYLLKQRATQKTSSYDRRPVAPRDSQWKQG